MLKCSHSGIILVFFARMVVQMRSSERLELILSEVDRKGFVTVKELSSLCQVNAITIRRDLKWLEENKRIRRTHGGAASLGAHGPAAQSGGAAERHAPRDVAFDSPRHAKRAGGSLSERIDVLIASSPTAKYETVLPDATYKKPVPVVAESTPLETGDTCVMVDNFEAGRELGVWAGRYAQEHFDGRAGILDLTYHFSNTQDRSRGFLTGVKEVIPQAELILSMNSQSRYEVAYQLTRDALAVHPHINLIFGMNDTSALGAVDACRDMEIDPERILVVTFGVEGDTFCNLILEGGYCKAGLAMFPDIVGQVCVEAAIALWSGKKLDPVLTTPHQVVTAANLEDYFERCSSGWKLRWAVVENQLKLPLEIYPDGASQERMLPRRIGFVYTFVEHEWYRSLVKAMTAYTQSMGIELEVLDVEQTLKDEIEWRRREIARQAAAEIRQGETISMDSGPVTTYLAEILSKTDKPLTVISNSVSVLDLLETNPQITLISTGGVLRRSSMNLVGPTAESTLREIRVDKLFLSVNGVSLDFGLSHSNMSEVTIKQAMIRSAREVILLADHTCFEQEAFIQVSPVTVINQLITDDALPASLRLELSKMGIRVSLASA